MIEGFWDSSTASNRAKVEDIGLLGWVLYQQRTSSTVCQQEYLQATCLQICSNNFELGQKASVSCRCQG